MTATRQMKIIGTVVSPYTKRMGTPRQSLLVPSSRGYVDFAAATSGSDRVVAPASLDGIDQYSHLWIIFEFHANTNISNRRTKIRPPRAADNVKVGQLATRSPHRPNSIGLSLVKFERWDPRTMRLHVSGLDLVNGTPVFDIKPCVPWDIPPGYAYSGDGCGLRVPDWVTQDDVISQVDFADTARRQLEDLVEEGRLEPLYTMSNDGLTGAVMTLKEIIAQDPRSTHKGVDNARGKTSKDETYSLIFCQCQVDFCVSLLGASVMRVVAVDFDPDSYVEGIPLISEQQQLRRPL